MNQTLRINHPQVVCETIDGEVVAVNLETGCYYSLLNTAAAVWNRIEQQTNCDRLIQEISHAYEGDSSEIAAAIHQFLEHLQRENLIVADATISSTALEVSAIVESVNKPRFENPLLEKFSDMQDLLLLDPIHEVNVEDGWPSVKTLQL